MGKKKILWQITVRNGDSRRLFIVKSKHNLVDSMFKDKSGESWPEIWFSRYQASLGQFSSEAFQLCDGFKVCEVEQLIIDGEI